MCRNRSGARQSTNEQGQRGSDVKRPTRSMLFCCVGLALAASAIDALGRDEPEPLWAYAFGTPPEPGDAAIPQTPPTRNLRPGEDAEEQTKSRRVDGSNATYSLVEIRDGHDVIDWFPGDHPPMPDVV